MSAKEKAAAPARVPPAAEREAAAAAAMPALAAGEVSQDQSDQPEAIEAGHRAGFVRKPFGQMGTKLSAAKRPGYHRHFFNDELNRIQDAQAAGYTHVKENGAPLKRVAGVAKGGGPLNAFLMEIPEKWFEEDMARGQAKVDEIDRALRQGNVSRKDNDERYVPKGSIRIRDQAGNEQSTEDEEE